MSPDWLYYVTVLGTFSNIKTHILNPQRKYNMLAKTSFDVSSCSFSLVHLILAPFLNLPSSNTSTFLCFLEVPCATRIGLMTSKNKRAELHAAVRSGGHFFRYFVFCYQRRYFLYNYQFSSHFNNELMLHFWQNSLFFIFFLHTLKYVYIYFIRAWHKHE